MKRANVGILLAVGLGVLFSGSPGLAAPKLLKQIGKVTAQDGMLHDAFALDEAGSKLAHMEFTASGGVQFRVGPPGGKDKVRDLGSFSGAPEKILALGGHWFVIANENSRRAAVVDDSGRILHETESFDDCELSTSPKAFVTYSQQPSPKGDRYSIHAYRPDGSTLAARALVVTPGGTIDGDAGLTFLGFTKSHLQAMVQKPGSYNPRSDVRESAQFSTYDVLTGKAGPGKMPPKVDNYLDYVRKRAEKPELDAVIVLASGQNGFELVGPGEQVRHLDLSAKDYDQVSLQQRQVGNHVVFSLVADRPGARKNDMNEEFRYSLAFFTLEPASGQVTAIGEVPLLQKDPPPWSVGGNKIAVLRKGKDGNREIAIYAK